MVLEEPLLVGRASACAGEERPSLFSDSGNRLPLFNPFAAAMATFGPAERYESQYMGATEFLNRRLNEEFQRAFDAGIPSSAIYPSPEIYHIGTPSDRTTSEGFRSALSHGTSSVPSYPTSSPVSFGPSTPVQSASAVPAGLQSSPGGMSDVGSTLIPPGLPLRDPPRMAGSYGVSLNDPVFGISSGSIPCENPGHRPTPAQAPIPPPPPQQGAGDPVAQLLVGQGAIFWSKWHRKWVVGLEDKELVIHHKWVDKVVPPEEEKKWRWMKNGSHRCQ